MDARPQVSSSNRQGSSMKRLNQLLCLAFAAAVFSSPCEAQNTVVKPTQEGLISLNQFRGSGQVASLKDQLRAGLKARRTVEFKFIDDVVRLVEQRKLPVKLVLETFQYARRKRTGYPFQFFQRALSLRAARIGVRVTPV